MPIDLKRYPIGWLHFSNAIRHARAHGRCECTGECGLHQPNPLPRRCTEINHQPATFAHGSVVLTVAHLCNCDPPCLIAHHVKAMCQRCHLRVDRKLHALHARLTRARSQQIPIDFPNRKPIITPGPLHPRRDPRRRF
jgi:hypothetical protein